MHMLHMHISIDIIITLSFFITDFRIIKISISCIPFAFVEISCKVFRYISIEQHT